MNNLKGKRLLLLGGSICKDAIKRFAEEHGVVLIATGNDSSAGIFEIAQESYNVDSTDIDSMKQLIKEKQIDGVYMGGSESVIAAACIYLNEMQMPCYCTKKQWNSLQDKTLFKKLCIKHDLPVAPRYDINKNNIDSFVDSIDFPIITKPADGCGSNGFSVCHNKEELIKGYEKAESYSPNKTVICEKFVRNDAVVVFYTFSEGKIYFSGLEDKYPVRYEEQGSYVGGLFVFESKLTDEFRNRFENKIQRMIESLGIKEGSAWIEVFHNGTDYYFNEVGFRYGGSVSVYPVDYFYQINQISSDIYFCLTGESMIYDHTSLISDRIPRKAKYIVYPIHSLPGTINEITGTEEIRSMDNVVLMVNRMSEGDHIANTGSFSQAFSLVHFVCDTLEECNRTIDTINKTLKVLDAEGKNMVNMMLDMSRVSF
jgi:carbamoylphosphate synthase large subunit